MNDERKHTPIELIELSQWLQWWQMQNHSKAFLKVKSYPVESFRIIVIYVGFYVYDFIEEKIAALSILPNQTLGTKLMDAHRLNSFK